MFEMSAGRVDLNLPELEDAIDATAVFETIGEAMVQDARRYVRVDTGELRDSIDHDVTGEGVRTELRVFADSDHALPNELGTRHMQAQPFLRPALYKARG